MRKITKSLLLGTAAGLVAVAGAQAADMPVKAAPVNYVKICTLYGDGFYYIPGTDICLKLGGYVRAQFYYNYGQNATGAATVTDGMWHQVAVSRQDGGRVALYIDGKIDGDGNSGSGDVAGNPYVFFCGVDASGGHYFTGAMDDVRQYDRVLTPSEVEAIFVATQ